ncbi:hypothetical protein KFE98_14540 [bacterium SCSIO 12741]|nr:hypothetical protein KFE98_14540 [bacterium SCSIO 12741]
MIKPSGHIILWTWVILVFWGCEKELTMASLPIDLRSEQNYVLDGEGRIKSLQITENGTLAFQVAFTYHQDSIVEISRDWRKNESSEVTYYLNPKGEVKRQSRYYFDCPSQKQCYTEALYKYKNNRLAEWTETTYQIAGTDSLIERSQQSHKYFYLNNQLVREEKKIGDYVCFRLYAHGQDQSLVNLHNFRAGILKIQGSLLRTSETDFSCLESNLECQNQYEYEYDDQDRISGCHFYRKCRDQFSNSTIYHSYTKYNYWIEE